MWWMLSSCPSRFAGERGAFDELGACAHDGDDFHLCIWILLTMEMYINVLAVVA